MVKEIINKKLSIYPHVEIRDNNVAHLIPLSIIDDAILMDLIQVHHDESFESCKEYAFEKNGKEYLQNNLRSFLEYWNKDGKDTYSYVEEDIPGIIKMYQDALDQVSDNFYITISW